MDSLLSKLEKYLIDPADWLVSGVPDEIYTAALAATDTGNLTAIGYSDDLGWFVLITANKGLDADPVPEPTEEKKEEPE